MTSCRDCGREWTGLAECHCAGCHLQFSSEVAFTRHQGADGCLDPTTVVRKSGKRTGDPYLVLREGPLGDYWTSNSSLANRRGYTLESNLEG